MFSVSSFSFSIVTTSVAYAYYIIKASFFVYHYYLIITTTATTKMSISKPIKIRLKTIWILFIHNYNYYCLFVFSTHYILFHVYSFFKNSFLKFILCVRTNFYSFPLVTSFPSLSTCFVLIYLFSFLLLKGIFPSFLALLLFPLSISGLAVCISLSLKTTLSRCQGNCNGI